MAESGCNVAAAMYDVQDQDVLGFNPVDDDVLAHGKTTQTGAQILVAAAAKMGICGEKKKPVREGINHAVGNVYALAFLGEVIPDVVELGFGFGFRCETMRR